MPEYKFICKNCGKKITVDRKMSEYNPKEPCPYCSQAMSRDIKDFGGDYICKTSGFYGKTSN